MLETRRIDDCIWEIPVTARAGMRVPARVFADEELLGRIRRDRSLEQLANVATLPGVTGWVAAMPDAHEGYGFPVGGVAALRVRDGVISPGGVGYDINCGVRLLASALSERDVRGQLAALMHDLARALPSGTGRGGAHALDRDELDRVLEQGVPSLVDRGWATDDDVAMTEARGCLAAARADAVSERARHRGRDQLGTIGSGNHFVEVQRVEHLLDAEPAAIYGLQPEQVVILIHTGSRGLGHQVCTDYVREMERVMPRYDIRLPDRQLAAAPFASPEGQRYFQAMCAAANFAWCNRQALTHQIRQVFARRFRRSGELRLVYDVAHNIAKVETYDGEELCVHRKGATRAFGPGHPETPEPYRIVGQPVFIPGSMGTASYVLAGNEAALSRSFGSTCHGAGRAMSRGEARRTTTGSAVRTLLAEQGIVVECVSNAELAEEAPLAYKDVERVTAVVERAGLARRVARLRPIGVLKG